MRGPCERSASLPLCSDEAPAADEDEAAQLCAAAVAMQKENQFEEAASLFGQALARFPDHVETLVRFGLMLVGQRNNRSWPAGPTKCSSSIVVWVQANFAA